jgi:hypothetical protein
VSGALSAPRGPGVLLRMLAAPGALAGFVVIVAIFAMAAFAPLLAPYDWNATSTCRCL